MITRLDHIDLKVPDLEEAIAFLGRLGMDVVRRTDPERGSVEMAFASTPDLVLEVRQGDVATTVVDHIAFTSDALEADVAALAADGIAVTTAPKRIAGSGRTIANVADATGVRWQIAG